MEGVFCNNFKRFLLKKAKRKRMAPFILRIATCSRPVGEIEDGGARDIANISSAPPVDFHFSSRSRKKSQNGEPKGKKKEKGIPKYRKTA